MNPSRFYDDLAEYYDLIFPDWERSMARQGGEIARMLEALGSEKPSGEFRVLDVAAGIGTQTLPLAALGYHLTARDLSHEAIARLRREAAARDLSIDAAPADMRAVVHSLRGSSDTAGSSSETVEDPFDAVIAFDNSIPHLQSDAEIAAVFRDFLQLLVPGGALLVSVRDYDEVDRTPTSSHPYGERTRAGRQYRLGQRWTWLDASHYRTTFVVEERRDSEWTEVVRTDALYYAISVARLLDLMRDAGFTSCRLSEIPYNQPVLIGQRPV